MNPATPSCDDSFLFGTRSPRFHFHSLALSESCSLALVHCVRPIISLLHVSLSGLAPVYINPFFQSLSQMSPHLFFLHYLRASSPSFRVPLPYNPLLSSELPVV